MYVTLDVMPRSDSQWQAIKASCCNKLDVLAHVATVTGKSQIDKPAVEQIFKSKTGGSCFPLQRLISILSCGRERGPLSSLFEQAFPEVPFAVRKGKTTIVWSELSNFDLENLRASEFLIPKKLQPMQNCGFARDIVSACRNLHLNVNKWALCKHVGHNWVNEVF